MIEKCWRCGETDPDHFGYRHTLTLEIDLGSDTKELKGEPLDEAIRGYFEEEQGHQIVKQTTERVCWNCATVQPEDEDE